MDKKPYIPAPGPDLFTKTKEEKEQEERDASQAREHARKMKEIKNQAALGKAKEVIDDSSDPEDVKEALYQAHLLKEGLSGKSPNSRHI